MLQFTTTTVVNKPAELIKLIDGKIRVGNLTFDPECCKVFYALAKPAKSDSLDLSTVQIEGLKGKICRLDLYIKSVGNADPLFANQYTAKGKSFPIEFKMGDALADTLKNIYDSATTYLGNYMGDAVFTFVSDTTSMAPYEGTGQKMYLVCANEYMRITKADIMSADPESKQGMYKVETSLLPDAYTMGNEGFGTYDHLMKDYRLPTGANLRWKRTMADEMPVDDNSYGQITIYMTKERGIMGLGAVGSLAISLTCHVLWVNGLTANDMTGTSSKWKNFSPIAVDEKLKADSAENKLSNLDDNSKADTKPVKKAAAGA